MQCAHNELRPLKLLTRFVEAGIKVGGFLFGLKTDEWTGAEDKMRPQRAIEARELITDLGVTFIKIAQVWASRPDILPKESLGRTWREGATDDLAFADVPGS